MSSEVHFPSLVKYRIDINGLRAWAVTAVLLFHFSLIGLPGGFAGVDVFFVISGYLMTAIIIGGYEKGNFSIWKFYVSRARRILPALIVVLCVLLVLGWFSLPNADYQSLAEQSFYGISFLSNINYWHSAGYFDSAAKEKWLLHTWSLAIEAQFYVLYPIFIALVWRSCSSLKGVTISVFIFFVISFLLCLIITFWKQSAAFYLLPTRGWELASGALVFLIVKQNLIPLSLKKKSYWLGWVLVISSFFFITDHLAWPSYWAAFPVIGTSLIILGNRENCKMTDNVVAQWLGDRSYSLYLWHWPLVVALYYGDLETSRTWTAVTIFLSFFFAHISYHIIELPTRKFLSKSGFKCESFIIIFITASLTWLFYYLSITQFDSRIDTRIEKIAEEKENRNFSIFPCSYSKLREQQAGCLLGAEVESIDLILVGDSHSQALASSVEHAAINSEKRILYLGGANGCPFIKGFTDKRPGFKCNNYINHIDKQLKLYPDIPLLIINSGYYQNLSWFNEVTLDLFLQKMRNTYHNYSKGRAVFVTMPVPTYSRSVPALLTFKAIINNDFSDLKVERDKASEKFGKIRQTQIQSSENLTVNLLDPMDYLCDTKFCYASKNSRPFYYDHGHLSEYGNQQLIPMFEQIFKLEKE